MIILLDNGHGNDTPGKCSPVYSFGQLFEWEFNRDIVQRVHNGILKSGHTPVILVPEKYDVPLPERCNRANDIYLKNKGQAILISIHANAGGGKGWEVFTSVGQTESDYLATNIFTTAYDLLRPIAFRRDNSDGDPDKEAQFYILKHTLCPAVLTENLFMDNEVECKKLMDEKFRQLLALIHINGILKYLK